MEIIIKITDEGYTKTIKTEKGEFIQKWVKDSMGFVTTDDSVQLDELGFTDDLIESIESIDFDLGDISNSLLTENSELPYDHDEAITNDGHKLERGDTFYSVASMFSKSKKMKSVPLKHKYPEDYDFSGSERYFDYQKCLDQCNLENERDA